MNVNAFADLVLTLNAFDERKLGQGKTLECLADNSNGKRIFFSVSKNVQRVPGSGMAPGFGITVKKEDNERHYFVKITPEHYQRLLSTGYIGSRWSGIRLDIVYTPVADKNHYVSEA